MIPKNAILHQIINQLTEQLGAFAGASRAMHADASDEQNKPEDRYDTRGLEATYLASSQARLATETEEALAFYEALQLRNFQRDTAVDLTALVELESSGKQALYFLGSKSGGLEICHKGTEILVITPESPLGRELVGKKTAGERIKFQTRGAVQDFRVTAVSSSYSLAVF